MALTPLPKPRGGQGHTFTRYAAGRAGEVAFSAPGLMEFLRDASQAQEGFSKALRKASEKIAEHVVDKAKQNASGQPPHGAQRPGSSGRSQAQVVANALRARRDRIPTIKLDHQRLYPSKSRSNTKRTRGKAFGPGLTRKVSMGDVFYGAEFGGRRRPTTQQFLRHRGRQGYFFWQAVRDSKSFIVEEYSNEIERILKELAKGAT